MPCFRGIDVSVIAVAGEEVTKLPEFPHPDGPSVNISTSSPNKHGSGVFLSPRRGPSPLKSGGDSGQLVKANPRISVYVPSLPDARFFFSYAINKPPPGQNRYLFFKVNINGHHIVAWGIELSKVISGTTYRALYEPSERYQHRENGQLLKALGIEARCFTFLSGLETKPVADDGGLIEVQVFRSSGRKGRAARLDQYRRQEKYGIAMLSDGLLDKPEDTTYYDYLLVDPKDAPYASFRFHYRSWKNLKQLQLISAEELDVSPSSSSSTMTSGASSSTERQSGSNVDDGKFSFRLTSLDDTVFDDHKSKKTRNKQGREERQSSASFFLRSPPERFSGSSQVDRVPQPSKALRDGFPESYLQRPLPELPLHELPKGKGPGSPTQHSRHSSATSKASITPSLQKYLEDESFMTDNVDLGVAKEVEVALRHDPSKQSLADIQSPQSPRKAPNPGDFSFSDYTFSPLSSDDSKASLLLSPGNYLATTGSLLERQLSSLSPIGQQNNSPRAKGSPKARQILAEKVDDDLGLPKIGTLRISESEWLRRTPSPFRGGILSPHTKRMWSPRPEHRQSALNDSTEGVDCRNEVRQAGPERKQEKSRLRTDGHRNEEDDNWI